MKNCKSHNTVSKEEKKFLEIPFKISCKNSQVKWNLIHYPRQHHHQSINNPHKFLMMFQNRKKRWKTSIKGSAYKARASSGPIGAENRKEAIYYASHEWEKKKEIEVDFPNARSRSQKPYKEMINGRAIIAVELHKSFYSEIVKYWSVWIFNDKMLSRRECWRKWWLIAVRSFEWFLNVTSR